MLNRNWYVMSAAAVAVVVDVDLVQHVVAELVEVRAAGRRLQRDVVGDQRDRVRLVRADERVEVGAVGDRVLGDLGRFAMRRHAITSQAGKGNSSRLGNGWRTGSDGAGASLLRGSPYRAGSGQPMARAIRVARSLSRSRVWLVPANTSMSPDRASRTCTTIGPRRVVGLVRGRRGAGAAGGGGQSGRRCAHGRDGEPGDAGGRGPLQQGTPGHGCALRILTGHDDPFGDWPSGG